jgi:hypothetical protein
MAWTAPSTFVAGAILTAASLNTNVRDNSLAGGPIYTTEALRDAAITSPFEGQRAYITGSTVATATGQAGTAGVPTGIQTIYNGSGWVCVTPVGARSSTDGTRNVDTYANTLTGDAVAVSATLTTGTSALVSLSMWSACGSPVNTIMSFAVSGATTLAAADDNGLRVDSNSGMATSGSVYVITGLTAGVNTFTLNYKANAAVATWYERRLVVQGIA